MTVTYGFTPSSLFTPGFVPRWASQRDPLWELKQASGLWSAMIRDTVRYDGNDKNSSDMECHQVGIKTSLS